MEGLQPKNFIEQLKMDGTFNEASFDREFESKWAGSIEGAFFDIEKFSKHRVIELPENEPSGRNNKDAYYIMGVDVGRFGSIIVAGPNKIFLIAGTSLFF